LRPPDSRVNTDAPNSGHERAVQKMELSRLRHELRTPINHILGYCEMLMEEARLPGSCLEDLRRIHAGGRELQTLIARYFDDERFSQELNLHQLYHELRTPVNHIIGYSDLLLEQTEEPGIQEAAADLRKIREAARTWLELMEAYLVEPAVADSQAAVEAGGSAVPPLTLNLGFGFTVPGPKSSSTVFKDQGALLVVDDDETSREMLARRLRRSGYTVSAISNGVHALALARKQKFDLVLLDMIMPGLDGFQVLAKFKAEPALRDIPILMLSALDEENGIARSIEMGAEDYLAKPFNPVFLRARIGACLEKKRLRDKELATHQALVSTEKRLAAELAEAAFYVRSLLPLPLQDGIKVRWHFQPSAELGGDSFGYHFLDKNRLAIYLLDVSGHGVGAALLSVSVLNVIRAESLAGTDFGDPASVLRQLNRVFQMERQNNLIFTLWYGVFDSAARRLSYASGGHPPAVLLEPGDGLAVRARELSTHGRVLGLDPSAEFRADTCVVPPASLLYLFSDGAFEVSGPDGRTRQLAEFTQQLVEPGDKSVPKLEQLVAWARGVAGDHGLEDDLSIMELEL
jgi:phosphoserine phosphatase RsbU/P